MYKRQHFGAATVATTKDPDIADKIADHLNGDDSSRFSTIAWQGCLDHANRNAVEARKALELKAAEADMLRTQLFETREQRDEARESSAANGAEAERAREYEIKMRLEAARALTERDELRKALEASHRELANARNYWANQGPHDHVVISLAGYNKLVAERDEALAKYAACVDVVSFVDGRWVRTS